MEDNKLLKIKKNVTAGLISKAISVVVPFISRTILLKIMGSEYLGLNGLFSSILNILNLAELGVDSAITYNMYKPIAENDVEKVNSLLKLYRKLYLIIGVIVVTIGVICTPFLRLLINGSIPDDVNLIIIFLVYLGNTSISYFLFSYRKSLLIALQRNDIVNNIATFIVLFQNIFQVVIFYVTKNFYLYSLTAFLFTVLSNLFCLYISKRNYPIFKPKGTVSVEQIETIKKQISGLIISKICVKSRNALDNVVISSLINLISVTVYSNYYYVIDAVHSILGTILISIASIIGNNIVTKGKEENMKHLNVIQYIYTWLSVWAMSCTFLLYQDFMTIWAGDKLLLDDKAALLFSVYGFLLCIGDVNGMYFDSNGLWWHSRKYTIIETVLNVFLNIVLSIKLGIKGVILASIISVSFSNLYYIPYILYTQYFGKKNITSYMRKTILHFFSFGIVCSLSQIISSNLKNVGFSLFLYKIMIVTIVVFIISRCLSIFQKESKDTHDLIIRVIKKL